MTDNEKKKWPQYLISFLCNISILTFGLQAGWLSPVQPSFESTNSPIGTILTTSQISWVGSLPSISLVLSGPVFGYIIQKFGRKIACLIATVPNILTYILLTFANNVYMIYIARLIGGFCSAGGFIVAPIYINETSEAHLKGFLCGVSGSFIKLGIIFSYILGAYTSYMTFNLASLSFTLIFLIFYLWMPESPIYLVSINKKEEARTSLKKLRGENTKIIEEEMIEIENLINETNKSEGFTLKNFFTTKVTLRALIIVSGIFTIQMLCGYPAIVRYSVNIFENTGESDVNPFLASIFLAISQLLCAMIGVSLLEKLGRKSLLLICTVIMILALLTLSTYLFVKDFYEAAVTLKVLKFLPTIAMIVFIGAFAAAYGSVPFLIVPELFAPQTRGIAATVTNTWISFLEFLVVKIFLFMQSGISLAGTLCIFAGNCIIGFMFIKFYMFETKGLSMQTILKRLNGELKDEDMQEMKPFIKKNDVEKKLEVAKAGTIL